MRGGVGRPVVNALGVSLHPVYAGRGEGGRRGVLHTRTVAIQKAGTPGGESGAVSREPSRGGSPRLHTPVTMTIQPQPAVSMAAACPIRLALFSSPPPQLRPVASSTLGGCSGRGSQGEGGFCVTLRRAKEESRDWRAELQEEGVAFPAGKSGGVEKGSEKWVGGRAEDFQCNSRLIWARCSP